MTPIIILYAHYSSKEWEKLFKATEKITKKPYLVINPNDGPQVDKAELKEWTKLVNRAQKNFSVLYYIDTCHAKWEKSSWKLTRKTPEEVQKEMLLYGNFPKQAGFFFDDYPDSNIYSKLEENQFVVGNPGTKIKAKTNLKKVIIYEDNGLPKEKGSIISLGQKKYPIDTSLYDLFYIHKNTDGQNPYEILTPYISNLLV